MVIAGTGHRPHKIGHFDKAMRIRLIDLAMACLSKYEPDRVITGMALGWDVTLAIAAGNLGIKYIAYVPFRGQESTWPKNWQKAYNKLLEDAEHVEICSQGGFSPAKMHYRNKRMVDTCDLLLALYNGTPGGTRECVKYAMEKAKKNSGKPKIVNVWKSWLEHKDKPIDQPADHPPAPAVETEEFNG